MLPAVSVLLAACDRPERLKLALACLAAQTDRNFEVIVCADAMPKPLFQMLSESLQAENCAGLVGTYVPPPSPGGAAVRNLAAATAVSGDVLVFVDEDFLAPPGFIRSVRAQLAPRSLLLCPTGVLSGADAAALLESLESDDEPALAAASIPWSKRTWMEKRLLSGFEAIAPIAAAAEYPPVFGVDPWRILKDIPLALWREDFFSVEGWDGTFPTYAGAAVDLVHRLQRAGVAVTLAAGGAAGLMLPAVEDGRRRELTNAESALLLERMRRGSVSASLGMRRLPDAAATTPSSAAPSPASSFRS